MSSASVCSALFDWENPLSAPTLPGAGEGRRARTSHRAFHGSENRAYPNEAAWLARVQGGDEDAARALVERLYPLVIKSIRCHQARFSSDEDLAQAVFAKLFARLNQYSGLVPLEHWVSRITVNTCLSQIGREKVRPELRMSDLSETDLAVVEHLLRTEDDCGATRMLDARELLGKLLAGLKPEERLVITLLHLEERSTQEISQRTGWSVSRVKVKAFRARHKMRKLWANLAKEYRSTSRGCSAFEL